MKLINKFWLLLIIPILPVQAQINPDQTLPTSTQINPQNNIIYIEQGTEKGNNLFHSFRQFSIPDGITAYFNNNANIQNIFSRVTGGEISQINGTIQANGNANLFLMNPQGIVFGKNASLQIGGSFLATTANSIKFADNLEFIASNQQNKPLLTVSIPVGLQFNQGNSGAIIVNGNGHNLYYNDSTLYPLQKTINLGGLKVQKGQKLTLIGGNINFIGGTLEAPEGDIILASIGEGHINLNNLDTTEISTFKNINITDKSSLETIGNGGGNIFILANNIDMKKSSVILVQNNGDKKAGNININTHQLFIDGLDNQHGSRTIISNENIANGLGGDLIINTDKFSVKNGALVGTLNFGLNQVGDVNIKANDSINIDGYNNWKPDFFSFVVSLTYNQGDSGNLNIDSPKINLMNGGTIASSTFLNTGNSGNININSQDMLLTGFIELFGKPSVISTATFSQGNAGDVMINTNKLTLENKGLIVSSTFAQGNAGSININASDSIKIVGNSFDNTTSLLTGISSASEILNNQLRQIYQSPAFPTGGASNISVNTQLLSLEKKGLINVSNISQKNAGTLKITADRVILNQSAIAGFTVSKEGGNIMLEVNKFLLLQNQSLITANALNNANGGNITINSPFIIAVSSENSDIIANAFLGKGGNININTQGIFGIQYNDKLTKFSDINATSQFGLNGIVKINNLGIDPEITLIKLPSTPIDISGLVAKKCHENNHENTFIITGRGGLPSDPFQPMIAINLQLDLGHHFVNSSLLTNKNDNAIKIKYIYPQVVEAKRWIFNKKNQIVLIDDFPSDLYYNYDGKIKCLSANINE